MNQFTAIFLFILSCSANNLNLLPNDFKVNFRADKINTFQIFINEVKENCKDKEVKSDCNNYFSLDTLNNLLNRYKSVQPSVEKYQHYYQVKKTVHDELQKMYENSKKVGNKNRKKGKQRSKLEIVITSLSGQVLAVARKFQDSDDDLNIVANKVEEYKEKERQDQRENKVQKSQRKTPHPQIQLQKIIKKQSSSEEVDQSSSSDDQIDQVVQNANLISNSEEDLNAVAEQTKQVKRRIVVLDILECEDCLEKGYVNLS